jgi:acyl carrier protein
VGKFHRPGDSFIAPPDQLRPTAAAPGWIATARGVLDTLAQIKELAAKQFGREPESIDENAPFDQLGIDSLGLLEFMFELEDHFGLSIPQENVANVRTLRELATAIDLVLAAGPMTPS